MTQVTTPFQQFNDTSGNPLEGGYIFVGETDRDPQTNPKAVYWDYEQTIVAEQPIRTSGGYPVWNGSAKRFYVDGDYSIKVTNKNNTLVFSAPTYNIQNPTPPIPIDDFATKVGVQTQLYTAFTTIGAAPNFNGVTAPTFTAYVPNQRFRVKFTESAINPKLSINGLAQLNILQYDDTGAKIPAVITEGQLGDVEYDGVDFILLNPLPFQPINPVNFNPPYTVLYPSIKTLKKAKNPMIDIGSRGSLTLLVVANRENDFSVPDQVVFYTISPDGFWGGLDYQYEKTDRTPATSDVSLFDGLYAWALVTYKTPVNATNTQLFRYSTTANSVVEITENTTPLNQLVGLAADLVTYSPLNGFYATTNGGNVRVMAFNDTTISNYQTLTATNVVDVALARSDNGALFMLVCFSNAPAKMYSVTSGSVTLLGTMGISPFAASMKFANGVLKIVAVSQFTLENCCLYSTTFTTGFTNLAPVSFVADVKDVRCAVDTDGAFYGAAVSSTGGVLTFKREDINGSPKISKYAFCDVPVNDDNANQAAGMGVSFLEFANTGLFVAVGSKKTSETSSFTATPVTVFQKLG